MGAEADAIMMAIVIVMGAFVVLIAVTITGSIYSASRRHFEFAMSNIVTNMSAAIGRAPIILIGIPLLVEAITLAARFLLGLRTPNVTQSLITGDSAYVTRPTALVSALVLVLVWNWVLLVMASAAIGAIERHERPQVNALERGFTMFLPALAMSVIWYLAEGLAFVRLIVPGFILWSAWSVSAVALVRERSGIVGSLSRSAELTRGARWSILLLLLVLLLVRVIGTMSANLLGQPFGFTGVMVARSIVSALATTLSVATSASIYHELKLQKEGVDTGELESVFA